MASNDRSLVLLACGDVGPILKPLEPLSELARPVLSGADIRFAQCERVYSDRGALQVHSGGSHSRLPPAMASVFDDCAFDVVSCASNHAMDWGPDALLDTVDLMRAKGKQVIGAGRNLEEARKPAFVERNGVRVAFLGYCSVRHDGYAAGEKSPGVAPLRAHTYYQRFDYQAGMPPRVVTIPYEQDLAGLIEDIRAAKQQADSVVVSVHWGVHFIPRVIADYQTTAAKAAFAAGADLILGHHAHAPKAIGVHDGKVCFYSLSNFMMSSTPKSAAKAKKFEREYSVKLDPAYPNLPYGSDGKRSLIAQAVITKSGVAQTSFLPVLIDTRLRPEPLRRNDPRFADAVNFMDWVSEDFDHKFTVEGDEVLISARQA
jgi:poly-gamma-glutamate synthesis protein (capsule biosynthesis protein)